MLENAVMSQEDFTNWKNHPVTKEIFKAFRQEFNELYEDWLNGSWLNDPVMNACNVGKAQAYQALLGITFDEASGEN